MSLNIQEEQFLGIIKIEFDSDLQEEIEVSKQLLPDTIPKKVFDQFVEIIESYFFKQVSADDLINIHLESEDIISLYVELIMLKKYLTKYDLDEFEDLGIGIINAQILIPRLIHLIKTNEIPLIQYDVLWILGNLATFGAFDKLIIQNDGIDIILQKLNSPYQQIQLQANWTLGNITTEGELQQVCRDQVRQKGGVELILKLLSKFKDPKSIEQCLWSLNNICSDGISFLGEKTVKEIIMQLCNFINFYDDEIVILACLESLSEIIPSTYENNLIIVKTIITTKLFNLVFHQKRKISIRSFEYINDLIESGGQVCDHLLQSKFLDLAEKLFKDERSNIKKIDVLSCVLFLCNGTENQQKLLIENETIIQEIFKQLQQKHHKFKAIIQSLVNLVLSKNKGIILVLVKYQIISNFFNYFGQLQDYELLEEMLKGLESIVSVVRTEIQELNLKDLINDYEKNQIKELFQFHSILQLRILAEQIIQQLE